jgi:uncharacterized protein (DUF2461 family)
MSDLSLVLRHEVPSDHPAIDLLRYKQYLAIHPIADATVTGPDFAGYVLNVFRIMQPFVAYIHEHSTGGQ